MFDNLRKEFSDESSGVIDSINDLYTREFGYGPVNVSVKDAVDLAIGALPSPPDRKWVNDASRGASTVTIFGRNDVARDSQNVFSMLWNNKGSPFDGHILKNGKEKRIIAPFSTYFPTAIWPYSADDGGRYTVHNFAEKDLPIPSWAQGPIETFMWTDLDIDQDGKADYGGVPLFRFFADPLMGVPPIALLLLLGYIASIYIPSVTPLLFTP